MSVTHTTSATQSCILHVGPYHHQHHQHFQYQYQHHTNNHNDNTILLSTLTLLLINVLIPLIITTPTCRPWTSVYLCTQRHATISDTPSPSPCPTPTVCGQRAVISHTHTHRHWQIMFIFSKPHITHKTPFTHSLLHQVHVPQVQVRWRVSSEFH